MIKLTMELHPDADPELKATTRFYPNGASMVCVEVSPGLVVSKAASDIQVGDMVCAFGPPRPGPGSAVAVVEEV